MKTSIMDKLRMELASTVHKKTIIERRQNTITFKSVELDWYKNTYWKM